MQSLNITVFRFRGNFSVIQIVRLELLRLLNYRLSFLFILPFFYLQETRILGQLKQMSKLFSITKYLALANSLTSCPIPTLQASAAEQKSIFVVQPLGKNNRILSLTSLEFLKSVSSNPTDSTGATPSLCLQFWLQLCQFVCPGFQVL